jgi:predicted nucleic acid-binding protein
LKTAYLESSIWINRSEGTLAHRTYVEQGVLVFDNEGWDFCISDAVKLEVLWRLYYQGHYDRIENYTMQFQKAIHIPVYSSVFQDALEIASLEGLRPLDAIHVAFAISGKCDCFVTADRDFRNLRSIPVRFIDLSAVPGS